MATPLVHLTLIDDATGETLGRSELEPESLPESFRDDTVLHLRDRDWSVVQAEPLSRAEYVASGQLVLRLRRIEHVDPGKILFSLPTICHWVPPTEGPLLEGRELLLHEDDWRQVEFVAASQEDVVDAELAEVARVLTESRTGSGFRDIHVRKHPHHPLEGTGLTLERLRQVFADATGSRVVLHDSSNCVTHSFSFLLSRSFVLYGLSEVADVEVLGVAALGQVGSAVPELALLRQVADEHGLLVVDWCGGRKARAGDSDFEDVLRT